MSCITSFSTNDVVSIHVLKNFINFEILYLKKVAEQEYYKNILNGELKQGLKTRSINYLQKLIMINVLFKPQMVCVVGSVYVHSKQNSKKNSPDFFIILQK